MPSVTYAALTVAIICEVLATTLLQKSQQFTRLWPTLGMVVLYIIAFYLLTLVLRHMSLGVTYAIWSASGIVLVTIVGFFAFQQRIDIPGMIGLGLIIAGVLVVNLFSKTVGH